MTGANPWDKFSHSSNNKCLRSIASGYYCNEKISPRKAGALHTLLIMKIAVLLFGTLKDAGGTDRITVDMPEPAAADVAGLLEECGRQFPKLAPWLPHVRVAVNLEYVGATTAVTTDDEVALLPPVAGGCD